MGLRDGDRDLSSHKLGAAKLQCLLHLIGFQHFHKSETLGLFGAPVPHQVHGRHLAVSRKKPLNVLIFGVIIQVADVKFP